MAKVRVMLDVEVSSEELSHKEIGQMMEPTDMRGIPYLADVKVYDKDGNLVKDETRVEYL